MFVCVKYNANQPRYDAMRCDATIFHLSLSFGFSAVTMMHTVHSVHIQLALFDGEIIQEKHFPNKIRANHTHELKAT